MAKRIKNPVEVKIVLTDEQTELSLHYGLGCEYGDLGRKGYSPELTAQEQITIKQVMDRGIAKIKEHEGIE